MVLDTGEDICILVLNLTHPVTDALQVLFKIYLLLIAVLESGDIAFEILLDRHGL